MLRSRSVGAFLAFSGLAVAADRNGAARHHVVRLAFLHCCPAQSAALHGHHGHPGLGRHPFSDRLVVLCHVLQRLERHGRVLPICSCTPNGWCHLPRRGRRSDHLPLGREIFRGVHTAADRERIDLARSGRRQGGCRPRRVWLGAARPRGRAFRRAHVRRATGRDRGNRRHGGLWELRHRSQRHDRRVDAR